MSEHPNLGVGASEAEWLASPPDPEPPQRRSVWAGWIAFASLLMIMMGSFNAIEGLAGILVNDFYVAAPADVLVFDLTTWGWLHLVIGVLVALTGLALLTGSAWARVVTVMLAIFNAITQVAFAAVYPVWSVIVIGLCVTVIWAVVVHGGDLTDDR